MLFFDLRHGGCDGGFVGDVELDAGGRAFDAGGLDLRAGGFAIVCGSTGYYDVVFGRGGGDDFGYCVADAGVGAWKEACQ